MGTVISCFAVVGLDGCPWWYILVGFGIDCLLGAGTSAWRHLDTAIPLARARRAFAPVRAVVNARSPERVDATARAAFPVMGAALHPLIQTTRDAKIDALSQAALERAVRDGRPDQVEAVAKTWEALRPGDEEVTQRAWSYRDAAVAGQRGTDDIF